MGTKLASQLSMRRIALPLLIMMGGCPTTPPDIQTTIDVSVEIVTDNFSPQIDITTAFFSFSEIELISDVDIEGYDLETQQIISTENSGNFLFEDVPPALYSRIKLKLNKPKPETELPSAFNGEPLSFLLEGTAQISNNQTVPLRIQDSRPVPNINVVLLQGIDVLPGDTAKFSLEGQIPNLFNDVTIEDVQPSDLTDGVLLIDLSDQPFLNSHPELEEIADQINNNLEITFSFTVSE